MSQPCEMQNAIAATSVERADPMSFESSAHSKDDLLAPAFAKRWNDILLGVACGGAGYPIVIGAIAAAIATYYTLVYSSQINPSKIVEAVFTAAIYTLTSSLIGFVWALIAGMVVFPTVYFFIRSLELCGSLVWLGTWVGGLTGFVALLPLVAPLLVNPRATPLQCFFIFAIGPGLATVLGQLGGAWGGRRAERKRERWYLECLAAASEHKTNEQVQDFDLNTIHRGNVPPRFQFQLRQLLWLGVWFSLLFTLIRVSSVPFEYAVPMLVGWFIFQIITHRIGDWLLPRVTAIWRTMRERQTRST